ncbi:GNAT family N-acetyltransferase [Paenibacillus hodogayensis]|uniref:GNAT family N-acetyltransferase n=1 Tax=Paenibacillus hodogayensis TaxID=279208 RepID=A0ABV5W6E9_9BACL
MGNETIQYRRLNACTFDEALSLWNRGFTGYYSDMTRTMEQLLNSFAANSIKPELSVAAFVCDDPAGFVFIATKIVDGRKWAWNGGTGVAPEYRGKGIAKALMREAQRVFAEEGVDCAILEVVCRNEHAISAYESGGFSKTDRIIGLVHKGTLDEQSFPVPDSSPGLQAEYGKASAAAELDFYRDVAAWECMWHNIKNGEALIVRDQFGEAAAYALFSRTFDKQGNMETANLLQCEPAPGREDRDALFAFALRSVYGPLDRACTRSTANLSTANPEVIDMLKVAGFETRYEQYLMVMDRSGEPKPQ